MRSRKIYTEELMELMARRREYSDIAGYEIPLSENALKLWAAGAPREIVQANKIGAGIYQTLTSIPTSNLELGTTVSVKHPENSNVSIIYELKSKSDL